MQLAEAYNSNLETTPTPASTHTTSCSSQKLTTSNPRINSHHFVQLAEAYNFQPPHQLTPLRAARRSLQLQPQPPHQLAPLRAARRSLQLQPRNNPNPRINSQHFVQLAEAYNSNLETTPTPASTHTTSCSSQKLTTSNPRINSQHFVQLAEAYNSNPNPRINSHHFVQLAEAYNSNPRINPNDLREA